MAITTDKAKQAFEAHLTNQIQAAEKIIDEKLKTATPNIAGIGISIMPPRDMDVFVRAKLVERYQKAGWGVEEVPDEREGNYWVFTGR